ncbi:MAG: hypothetical protein ACK417_09535 [Bacteroidia bacterium]
MKKLISLLLGLITAPALLAQSSEFKLYANGLIYSETAMVRLRHVVDSLNIKFRSCEINPHYLSIAQAKGHHVQLKAGNMEQAMKDMDSQQDFEVFLAKYPKVIIKRDELFIKSVIEQEGKVQELQVQHFDLSGGYGSRWRSESSSEVERLGAGRWVYIHYPKTSYSEALLTAFYFLEDFYQKTIPLSYARMIAYADCVIDTTSAKIQQVGGGEQEVLPENWQALDEEEKLNLLKALRSTRVMGMCSHDDRPRVHAVSIALLSAETYQWEVFLKAHLDIMNDRFERASDGSYAWGKRKTYIKELELLDLELTPLMLGISLRIQNPAEHHYFGSIHRLGRALAESSKRASLEEAMFTAIADSALDDYNRLLIFYLFKNYVHYTDDEVNKQQSRRSLAEALGSLPECYRTQLSIDY